MLLMIRGIGTTIHGTGTAGVTTGITTRTMLIIPGIITDMEGVTITIIMVVIMNQDRKWSDRTGSPVSVLEPEGLAQLLQRIPMPQNP